MPAARLLTLLEGEEEASVQEALDALEEARVTLDARELPPCTLSGELAARLLELGASDCADDATAAVVRLSPAALST